MIDVDLTTYKNVIETVSGLAVSSDRPREAMESVLPPEERGMVIPVIQSGQSKYYSEAVFDRFLEEHQQQRLSLEAYRQTFEETDEQVSKLLIRLGVVFAMILTAVVFLLGR